MKKPKSSRAKKDLDDPYYKGTSSLDLKSELPSPDPGKLLPLNEVHDKDFEIICVSILEEEPEVSRADLKRKDGVSQFGVDAEGIADKGDDFDLDVLSAKCYQKIIPSHLKKWGDDFLKHLDGHWKDKNIRRFILAVTVELTRDTVKKQITLEEKRFHAKGIKYEIWGLRQLEAKLRSHRAVIERYFHPGWADRVCGQSTSGYSSETGRLHFQENIRLKNELNSERLKKLKEELKKYNSGRPSSMGEVVDSIRNDQTLWSSLGDEDKAYVLRADIIRMLNDGNVVRAEKIHDECKPLLPTDADKDLPAYIAYMKGNVTEALNILNAPTNIREKTMRCSLLIELGEVKQALGELKTISKKDKKSAEVRRIQAIALAKQGKDKKALKVLRKAENLEPENYIIKWTGAILRYLLALSPAVPRNLTTYPQPIPRDLVREDDNALALLDEAAISFQHLRENAETDLAAKASIWKLATLANNSRRSDEAQGLAAESLSKPNPPPLVVAWALTRGYPVNEKKIIRSFGNLLEDRKGDINHLITVVNLHLHRDQSRKASKLLEKYAGQFDDDDERKRLEELKVLIAGEAEGTSTASILNDENISDAIAKLPNDERYTITLWEIAETLASVNRWNDVFQIRLLLTKTIKTARAYEMAAIAAFNTQNFQEATTILSNAKAFYPKQELPHRLRRMEIEAARLSGDFSLARKLSQSLAWTSGDTDDRVKSVDIKLIIGDKKGAQAEIKNIENRDEIPPHKLIEYARRFRREDPQFARELLQSLQNREIDSGYVTAIYELALDLGDRVLSEVMLPRLSQIAALDEGSTQPRAVSIPDNKLIEFLKRQQEANEQRRLSWLAGEQPAHHTFDNGIFGLGHIFWNCLEIRQKRDHWDPEYMLLLRSGGRVVLQDLPPLEQTKLYLDTSSLLLAFHMGLLEKLEQEVSAIVIPQALPTALQQLEDEVPPVQLHLREAEASVQATIENGDIGLLRSDEKKADYLCSSNPDEKSEYIEIIGIDRIIHTLEANGITPRISENKTHIDDEDTSRQSLSPIPLGARIQCDEGILIDFYRSGIIDHMTSNFELLVSEQTSLHLKHITGIAEESQRATAWIKDVREFIALKLDREEWSTIPVGDLQQHDDKENIFSGSAIKQCLYELINLRTSDHALIWIEDRFVSGYGNNGRHPLVTVPDLLAILRQQKSITDQDYYRHLHQLRAYGYGFLPIQTDELFSALKEAPIQNQVIINTPKLRGVRRSLFEQLDCTRYLVETDGEQLSDGRANEFWIISRLWGLADRSISELWNREDISYEKKFIWSEWIWKSLRVDQTDHLPINNNTETNRHRMFVVLLSGLLSSTLAIVKEGKNLKLKESLAATRKKRQEYINWVIHRVIAPATAADKELIKPITNLLAETLSGIFKGHQSQKKVPDKQEAYMNKLLFSELLFAFPKDWRERLMDHSEIRSFFGSTFDPAITLGELAFEPSKFWNAIQQVLSGRSISLHTRDESAKINLEVVSTAYDDFKIKSTGALNAHLDETALLIASSSKNLQINILEKNSFWIDRAKDELNKSVSSISQENDPMRRMHLLDKARANSVAYGLSELAKLIQDQEVDHDALKPKSPKALRGFLRLHSENKSSISDALIDGINRLLEEFSPLETLSRVGGLPVTLPTGFIEMLSRPIDNDTEAFRNEIRLHSITPLMASHLARAINGTRLSTKDKQSLAFEILADAHEKYECLFLSILAWSFRGIENDPSWIALNKDECELLVWVHANNILRVMINEQVEPKSAAKVFNSFSQRPLIKGMQIKNGANRTLSNMLHLPTGRLLYDGLSYSGLPVENLENEDKITRQLRQILGIEQNGEWFSGVFTMVRPQKEKPNDCWIGDGKPEYLLKLVGSDKPTPLVTGTVEECGEALLNDIEKSPFEPMRWIHLAAFGIDNLTNDQLKRILETGKNISSKRLLEGDIEFNQLEILLSLYGDIAMKFEGTTEALASRIEELVSSFVTANPKARASDDLAAEDRASTLLVSLLTAALHCSISCHDDLKSGMGYFVIQARTISEIWPGSREGVITILDRVSRELPFDCMIDLSRLSNELRGMGTIH